MEMKYALTVVEKATKLKQLETMKEETQNLFVEMISKQVKIIEELNSSSNRWKRYSKKVDKELEDMKFELQHSKERREALVKDLEQHVSKLKTESQKNLKEYLECCNEIQRLKEENEKLKNNQNT